MTNTVRVLPLVLAAAAVLATPGCGFTISTSASATPATSSPTSAVRPVEVAVPASEPDEPSLDDAAELIRPYLLAADEVGPGFSAGEEPVPDASVPAICGGPNTVAQYPIAVRVGATFDGPVAGVQVTETVSVYEDAGTAQAAYQHGVDGVSCGEGTVAGEPVAIAPAEDLTVDVGGEQATGWVLGNEDFDVIIVTVRSDAVVWTFTYLAAGDTFDDLPDALQVSAAGVAKFS